MINEYYAIVTLCLKRLIEQSIPITFDIISICMYSFTSFKPANFEITLERTMKMMQSYMDFYKNSIVDKLPASSFEHVLLYILHSTPACNLIEHCKSEPSNEYYTTIQMSRKLISNIIEKYKDLLLNPDDVIKLSKQIYTEETDPSTEDTSSSNKSSEIFTTNG